MKENRPRQVGIDANKKSGRGGKSRICPVFAAKKGAYVPPADASRAYTLIEHREQCSVFFESPTNVFVAAFARGLVQVGLDRCTACGHHHAMKVILAGDLHIGRSSSRVSGVSNDVLRAAGAWGRLVDLAIQERVSLVCLSGDVADESNKYWEAVGALERGVGRLAAAGIRTLAVAGNHDFDVLPKLADAFPEEHFKLVGAGGTWERVTVHAGGEPALYVDGWSFPTRRVTQSPLLSYGLAPDHTIPILGMVHGDLGVADSPYAPLELQRLRGLGPSAWLLGHIHAPKLHEGSTWVLYPGSAQALDPGEPGVHGAWLVEVSNGVIQTPQPRPLSSVRYDHLEVDLGEVEEESDLDSTILEAVRASAGRIADESGSELQHVTMRLKLTGHTPVAHRVREIADQLVADFRLPLGEGTLTVESVDVQTLPAINLDEHAQTQSAPGALARLLLELEGDDVSEEAQQLVRQVRCELQRLEKHKDYASAPSRDITEQMARDHLLAQGRELLTGLVVQKS